MNAVLFQFNVEQHDSDDNQCLSNNHNISSCDDLIYLLVTSMS